MEIASCRNGRPVATVIICAYNSRGRIDRALDSLRAQDVDEPFEVIVVASGNDGCATYLALRAPDVQLVSSNDRLFPGAARNAGIARARGEVIAFLPDDGLAAPGWLQARLQRHREGFPLVAGAIANGTPLSAVGTASYYVEYAASMPIAAVLRRQPIPHTVSYVPEVFDRLGLFPEIEVPGEDTLFNHRCMEAGLPVAYEPRASIAHLNLTRVRDYLDHQRDHGRGLARCVLDGGLSGPFELAHGRPAAAVSAIVRYPLLRWVRTIRLLAAAAPLHVPPFLLLTPLIAAGYVSGGVGSWETLSESIPSRDQ